MLPLRNYFIDLFVMFADWVFFLKSTTARISIDMLLCNNIATLIKKKIVADDAFAPHTAGITSYTR
jgi:hypothetical protein